MSNVGFIGVGYMGYGMAKNLLKKHNHLLMTFLKKKKRKELRHYKIDLILGCFHYLLAQRKLCLAQDYF